MPRKRKVRDRSGAPAEATVMTDQAAADQTQANDDAQAETSFAGAEASQTDTSWNSLATTLNGQSGAAWATFEWHKAQALDSWQTTADNNYTQYVSTLAGDEVTYASTDSQKFLSEAQTVDAADKSDGDNDADADQTLVNTLASDEVAYETTAATATAAYRSAMAQAAHDNTVSLAAAVDNYAHDGNSTNYTNAVNAAATALANARSAAATQYQDGTVATTGADGIGVATATQETNDANALLTDAQTVAGDDLTDAQTADLQIDTYSKAESDAYDLQTKNDATALDTLIKGDADSLKAKAATTDTSSPSSWMDQWAAQTSADDTKEDADADAALSATNSTADALDLKEKNEADAQQKKDDGDAQAAHDQAVADAQAAHDRAISDAGNITAAVAKDAYSATLPDAYPAITWDPSVNPALLDASYDEVYAVDDLALPLTAGQDDGSSPLPPGDVIGAGVMAGSPDPATGGPAPILGQSFSLGATTDPYDGIALSATPMVTTLLNDNGVYDPGNPYSSFSGWAGFPWLTGETPVTPTSNPGSGNPPMVPGPTGAPPPGQPGGGGGQQNPSSPPGQPAPLVPPTNAEAPEKDKTDASQEENAGRKQPAPNGEGHVFVFGFLGRRVPTYDAGDASFNEFEANVKAGVKGEAEATYAKKLKKNVDDLTAKERRVASQAAKDLVTVKTDYEQDVKDSAPQIAVLEGVAIALGFKSINEASAKAPEKVKGYTVRIVLVGYSFGAARAVDEANKLDEAIRERGMIPDIAVEVIDGVENREGTEQHGQPLIRTPVNETVPVGNHYAEFDVNRIKGGSIPRAKPDLMIKGADHQSIDEAVLTNKNGLAFAETVVDWIVRPFPARRAAQGKNAD